MDNVDLAKERAAWHEKRAERAAEALEKIQPTVRRPPGKYGIETFRRVKRCPTCNKPRRFVINKYLDCATCGPAPE